jgi:hypothetical protein
MTAPLQAVKTAIISVFLEQKAHAYHALVGLTWRVRMGKGEG